MLLKNIFFSLPLTAFAGLGGYIAWLIQMPLPFMLGSLLASGAIALFLPRRLPDGYVFPQNIRLSFMAVIGVMIGTRVTPDLLAQANTLIVSIVALAVFVCVVHGLNYVIFRRVGGFDKATAFCAGTPGGLLESLALAEDTKADIQAVTLQQFLRIIVVIAILPLGLSLWYGAPIGSAGGETLGREDSSVISVVFALAAGAIGVACSRIVSIPAGQLTWPLLIAAAVTLTGFVDLSLPQWLVNLAQIVVGTSLGLRFIGMRLDKVIRSLGLTVLSVGVMLPCAAVFAAMLQPILGARFDVLLISFAPGGVTEMALVALSLQANPAFVTFHHVVRIFLTVIEMSVLSRIFLRRAL